MYFKGLVCVTISLVLMDNLQAAPLTNDISIKRNKIEMNEIEKDMGDKLDLVCDLEKNDQTVIWTKYDLQVRII